MGEDVIENERWNMGNHDERVILTGWKDADEIIGTYDRELTAPDGKHLSGKDFEDFDAVEQAYVRDELNEWLASKSWTPLPEEDEED